MKHIIYISPNINKDGAERSLVALQTFIDRQKDLKTILIIPKHGPIEDLLMENGICFIIHPFWVIINQGKGNRICIGFIKLILNRLSALLLFLKLKRRNINPLFVHTNTITTDFGFYLSRLTKTKHIWHIREFGKLDFNFDFDLGTNYLLQCSRKTAAFICNSDAVRNYYAKILPLKKLTTIYNGVSPRTDSIRISHKGNLKLILIGRLSEEKGQKVAINACKFLHDSGRRNFQLDLYGTGKDFEVLKQLISNLALDEFVTLKGYQNNIPIHKYDIGLMCSGNEAFGRVTVEYMLAGLTVLGADSGGTNEIITNKTGILFETGNAHALSKAMITLYDNRDLIDEFGIEGQERAKQLFSEEQYCEKILNTYNTLSR
jgi:glycosyltransferase involved in cell wall biosynthesis